MGYLCEINNMNILNFEIGILKGKALIVKNRIEGLKRIGYFLSYKTDEPLETQLIGEYQGYMVYDHFSIKGQEYHGYFAIRK